MFNPSVQTVPSDTSRSVHKSNQPKNRVPRAIKQGFWLHPDAEWRGWRGLLGATSGIHDLGTPSLFYRPAGRSSRSTSYKKIYPIQEFFSRPQNTRQLLCASVSLPVCVCACRLCLLVSERHPLVSYAPVRRAGDGAAWPPRPPRRGPARPSALHRVSLPRGVAPGGAPVLSEPLDVPVFLAEDGDLVLEQDGVQSHPGVDQRHGAKPAGELVHAGLPLGKVVGIGPAGSSRRLPGTGRERKRVKCRGTARR